MSKDKSMPWIRRQMALARSSNRQGTCSTRDVARNEWWHTRRRVCHAPRHQHLRPTG